MQTTCIDCDFCENLAKKAVTQKDISEYSGFFNGIADGMVDGEFF